MTSPDAQLGRVAQFGVIALVAVAAFFALADAYVDTEPIVDLDQRVEQWVAGPMPSWAEWVARPFTWVGGLVGVLLVVGILGAALLRAGRRGEACLLLGATVGVQIVVAVLKSIYGRPRPDAGSPIDLPQSTSFPSGHAATGITLFGALAVIAASRVRSPAAAGGIVALGLLLGVAVGASRVVLNVHFVSDVLAGFCVGLAWLATCLVAKDLVAVRSRQP